MRVCPKCHFEDDPMWKPLAWRIYWDYAPQETFIDGYPHFKEVVFNPPKKKKCESGNFYYHFEDEYYYYQVTTPKATRKLVRRFPKGFESMGNRDLFEKTPSEKGFHNPNQCRLFEETKK